jgi:hypothetical protein
MTRRLDVSWGHQERAVARSVEELDELLDRLDAAARADGRPQDVQLTASDGGGTLGVVVGDRRTVLNHVPADGDPPYMTSRGEEDADRVLTFFVAGDHHSEAHWRNTVPMVAGREAARTFLLSGRLDDRVRWEEV